MNSDSDMVMILASRHKSDKEAARYHADPQREGNRAHGHAGARTYGSGLSHLAVNRVIEDDRQEQTDHLDLKRWVLDIVLRRGEKEHEPSDQHDGQGDESPRRRVAQQ